MAASSWGKTGALAAILAAVTPADAQRLAYEDSSEALGEAPRLAYDFAPEPETAASTGSDANAGSAAQEAERGFLQYGLLDRLEWIPGTGADSYSWDLSAFLGGPIDRIWISTVGDGTFGASLDYLELQALFSRSISGWDFQAGLRYDARPRPQRVYATVGVQGDATDELWLGAFAYLSNKGELSGRLVGQYNLSLTKALILQPSFELDAFAKDIPVLGVGRGLSYGEAGLRLRYEIDQKFAPYVGFSWERSLGRTARFARDAGEEVGTESLVLGVRSEF